METCSSSEKIYMNIVYKFTSKSTGKWYIGSKVECTVLGNDIIDRYGKKYFTSSLDEDLREEFLKGNMLLSVIEKNIPRENLLERERYYQEKENAVESNLSYNKCLAIGHGDLGRYRKKHTGKSVGNIYGQTVNEIANHNSLVSRKDNKANEVGFSDYGTMYYEILKDKASTGRTFLSYDKEYNQNGFFKRVLKSLSHKEFEVCIDLQKIRNHVLSGCTFFKACEIEGYPDYVVRYHFGDTFENLFKLEERLATFNGFEKREDLDKFIMRSYLSGCSYKEIERKLESISSSTVQRVVERIVRERLKIDDFE